MRAMTRFAGWQLPRRIYVALFIKLLKDRSRSDTTPRPPSSESGDATLPTPLLLFYVIARFREETRTGMEDVVKKA